MDNGHGAASALELGLADAVGFDALPQGRSLVVKMGFDPTAPDLHLGHAVGLFAIRRLQDLGHKAILVVGDFTAAIGDPTGRNEARPALGPDEIARNAKTYAEQAFAILDASKTTVVFNSAWLGSLGAAGLIKLASQATVSQMLARDDFAARFKARAPIGAHELLYPLLQARDSVELMPHIEFGGTDQRFNLLMGRELMREAGQAPQACAMVPLLLGLDGKRKMSKSLGNHIGITERAQSMFDKTMSISDETMRQWASVLGLEGSLAEGGPMESKKLLGSWIAATFHGDGAALQARASWEGAHQKGLRSEGAPHVELAVPREGRLWAGVLRDWGWEASGARARERIAQGALRLDEQKVDHPKARLMPGFKGLARYGAKHAVNLVTTLAEPSLGTPSAPPEIRSISAP